MGGFALVVPEQNHHVPTALARFDRYCVSLVIPVLIPIGFLVREVLQIIAKPIAIHQWRKVGQIAQVFINRFAVFARGWQRIRIQAVADLPIVVYNDDIEYPFSRWFIQKCLSWAIHQVLKPVVLCRQAVSS